MTMIEKSNKRVPKGWRLLVNDGFVSDVDAEANKLADRLEHEYAQRFGVYSRDDTFPIFVDNVPPTHVILRAIDVMFKRGRTVYHDYTVAASNSASFTVGPVKLLGVAG
jgi:hypothetical protein